MTFSSRDRRALAILPVAAVLGYVFWPGSGAQVVPARKSGMTVASQSVDQAEARLARLREIAATVPAKEGVLKGVAERLATREKGLLVAETAPQAQAQLLQLIRRLAMNEAPPVEIRSAEIGSVGAYGDAYGAVNISVQLECRVEQLINLLAAVGSQPELIAPTDLRVMSSSPKEKTLGIRLTLTALMPRKLVPDKKGGPL